MLKDTMKITGTLNVKHYDSEYRLIQELDLKNLVVNTGKNFIAQRMVGTGTNIMSHMAVGGTNASQTVLDTALGSELARVALTTSAVSENTITYVATFPAGTPSLTSNLYEAGIFNAASAGTMLCRTTFGLVTKNPSDIITITWQIALT